MMKLGKHKLYTSVVATSLPKEEGNYQKQNIYIENRHDAMAARYYYYASICRINYDDCLLQLSREFFLSWKTIVSYLKLRLYAINTMVENKTSSKELAQIYPWYNWSQKPIIK